MQDEDDLQSDPYAEDLTEPGEQRIAEADDPADIVPFQYSVTGYGADYPVDGLVKRLREGDVYVPKFQRAYVWDSRRASKFVESLLLGLPVPGIFLSREEDTGKLLVIDGQQRLRTLEFFYNGEFGPDKPFALVGVQSQFDGLTYEGLDPPDRRRLDDSIVHATVVRQDVPSDDDSSIYHLFTRLNTGGLQLTAQEIRASIFHGSFNELLHELNATPSWRRVFGRRNRRMRDQELILRFLAFYFQPEDYGRSMKGFLNSYMGRNRSLALQSAVELSGAFIPTIDAIDAALGSRAFRPRGYMNAAVFDSVMIGLARALAEGATLAPNKIAAVYRKLVRARAYTDATEVGTNAAQSVEARMRLATAAFRPPER